MMEVNIMGCDRPCITWDPFDDDEEEDYQADDTGSI